MIRCSKEDYRPVQIDPSFLFSQQCYLNETKTMSAGNRIDLSYLSEFVAPLISSKSRGNKQP